MEESKIERQQLFELGTALRRGCFLFFLHLLVLVFGVFPDPFFADFAALALGWLAYFVVSSGVAIQVYRIFTVLNVWGGAVFCILAVLGIFFPPVLWLAAGNIFLLAIVRLRQAGVKLGVLGPTPAELERIKSGTEEML